MKLLHKFFCVLICLTIFCGCNSKNSGENYDFTFNLASNPGNLDPQLAEDSASIDIIKNTFRGLMKENSDGSITKDAAENFTMSDDGLTYTFTLKDNIFWWSSDEYKAPLTAYDFVFAFRRIFDKSSSSPYMNKFLCIENAREIIDGNLDYTKIGVRATDKNTVEFSLDYPYFNFAELMSLPAAFPCNEGFFKSTKGRYGLAVETCISNGAFYVADWNYDPYWNENFIEIYRNPANFLPSYETEEQVLIPGEYEISPHSVFYHIKPEDSDSQDFAAGDIDAYSLDFYDKKLLSGKTYSSFQTKAYVLVVNPNKTISDSRLIRAMAAYANDFGFESEYIDGNILERGKGLVPAAVSIMGKSYRGMVSDISLFEYDDTPKNLWETAYSDYEDGIGDVKITIPESFPDTELIYALTDGWRENFGVNFLVEVVSNEEYSVKKAEQNYDIILAEITAKENNPEEFFSVIQKEFDLAFSTEINANLESVHYAESLSNAVSYIKTAEESAVNSGQIIPLFYGYEYFITDENASEIEYIPFSKEVIMRKAKMY
jgi:oligopeptide transport system substrate-binding protein